MKTIDILVAPQATRAEIAAGFGAAATGTVLTVGLALWAELPLIAVALIGLIAFDLFGGAVVNATRSAKRWFHREGRTARHHLLFVALHVQPFLLALVVPGFDWALAGVIYVTAGVAAVAITSTPDTIRRPVAFVATALGLVLVTSVLAVPPVLAWFAPVLLVKLLLSHLLPEEAADPAPQRPAPAEHWTPDRY